MSGCGTSRRQTQSEQGRLARAARPDDLVGDADRQRTAELVGTAFAEGLVDLDEMDRALDEVFRSRTVGDLDAATSMFPREWVAASRSADSAARRVAARRAARSEDVRSYLGVMALLLAIWAVTAVAWGATYFWPIWPALGWGISLLVGQCGRQDSNPDH